ncbi:MAG: cytochrome c biogenesis protein ResB [Spirochaetales bacterium]|nr:cytochrome c biogenesis protein ResB [Spirochaetales bacterium]
MRPFRFLRSLTLTAVLLSASALYAAIATVTGWGFRSPVFLSLLVLFGINLAACTVHRLVRHPHRRVSDYLPDVSHIGLLILLLGGVGSLLGRHEQALQLSPGDRFTLGRRFELTLEDTERTDDNWISRFSVSDGETADFYQMETRVNRPFRIARYTVYQTAWAYVSVVRMAAADGEEYTMAENEGFQIGEDVYLFERGDEHFELVWSRGGAEQGRVPVVVGQQFGDLVVVGTSEVPSTVITLVRDPGVVIVLVGSVILTAALFWFTVERALRRSPDEP